MKFALVVSAIIWLIILGLLAVPNMAQGNPSGIVGHYGVGSA